MTSKRNGTALQGEIKERPIPLSERWVRALLAGRKTQTRRLIDLRKVKHAVNSVIWADGDVGPGWYAQDIWSANEQDFAECDGSTLIKCPFGVPGDRLWVKETFGILDGKVHYRASSPNWITIRIPRWKSSRFMRREFSRLNARITDVRAERIQHITEADVRAEGICMQRGDGTGPGFGFKWHGLGYEGNTPGYFHTPQRGQKHDESCACHAVSPQGVAYSTILKPWQCAWREAWDALHPKPGETWDANPWVWAITFERI